MFDNNEQDAKLYYKDGIRRQKFSADSISAIIPELGFHASILKEQSEEVIEAVIDKVFNYVRTHDVLTYDYDYESKMIEFEGLREQDYLASLYGRLIKGSTFGLGLAWSYFPHHLGIKCGDMRTPLDILNDDVRLRRALKKMIRRDMPFDRVGFRAGICYFSGTQRVSNFRPPAAGFIYELLAGGGTVWDMSCGFGGRLLGALTCDRVTHYIGTDPSELTYKGLLEMADDFEKISGKKVSLYKLGSEDFEPERESLDLCFTSPPYFDTEKYSEEETQSYIKFPTCRMWLYGFMRQTLLNCWYGLKDGGYLVLNIATVNSYPAILEDVKKVALKIGFDYVHTLQLGLMHVSKGGMNKSEPVVIFRKGVGCARYHDIWLAYMLQRTNNPYKRKLAF